MTCFMPIFIYFIHSPEILEIHYGGLGMLTFPPDCRSVLQVAPPCKLCLVGW